MKLSFFCVHLEWAVGYLESGPPGQAPPSSPAPAPPALPHHPLCPGAPQRHDQGALGGGQGEGECLGSLQLAEQERSHDGPDSDGSHRLLLHQQRRCMCSTSVVTIAIKLVGKGAQYHSIP